MNCAKFLRGVCKQTARTDVVYMSFSRRGEDACHYVGRECYISARVMGAGKSKLLVFEG